MDKTGSTPRYPFAASADIVLESSGAKVSCRVTELSLYGCYLDCSAPLAVRSQVLLKIYGTDDYFEASATVIYANPSSGVGLVFREVKPAFAPILQRWLLVAMRAEQDEERG